MLKLEAIAISWCRCASLTWPHASCKHMTTRYHDIRVAGMAASIWFTDHAKPKAMHRPINSISSFVCHVSPQSADQQQHEDKAPNYAQKLRLSPLHGRVPLHIECFIWIVGTCDTTFICEYTLQKQLNPAKCGRVIPRTPLSVRCCFCLFRHSFRSNSSLYKTQN